MILLGVAGYFSQKWMSWIEETLKEHSSSLKAVSRQISSLEQAKTSETKDLSETVRAQFSQACLPKYEQIEEIKSDLHVVKETISHKILPQLESHNLSAGSIKEMNSKINDQDEKLLKLYAVLKAIIEQTQKNRK